MPTWDRDAGSLDFTSLQAAYRAGAATPEGVVEAVYARIRRRGNDAVWIDLVPESAALAQARDLDRRQALDLPLYGLPFAIKDNIDLAGRPTTAACPEFAYTPERSATAVERLIAAGAIPIGKTNLDQFATGLTGVLSPYGAPSSPFHPEYISGGSSSGSAVAVAAGLVSFALGTDTAGSGRVPAAFNNLVGLKPTRGLVSTTGVVPACRSLDCVSVLALTCDDAWAVFRAMQGADRRDALSRTAVDPPPAALPAAPPSFRLGVPAELEFFGDMEAQRLFGEALARMEQLGAVRVAVDFAPFAAAASLLYGGPWIAERYAAVGAFLEANPNALHPVTRAVIANGARPTAAEAFRGQYRLAELHATIAPIWSKIDALAVPTAPTTPRRAEVAKDAVSHSRRLGTYTNFVNLLDLAAVAVPAGFDRRGLPFGVTLIGPAWRDAFLCSLGDAAHRSAGVRLGASPQPLPPPRATTVSARAHALAVVGAHLSGMALNHELVALGASLVRSARTAPSYRLHALAGTAPAKPGLERVADGGAAIEIEVWDLPNAQVGRFLAGIGAPLALGRLELDDGSWVTGFVCEPIGLIGATDLTHYGGWRAYLRR